MEYLPLFKLEMISTRTSPVTSALKLRNKSTRCPWIWQANCVLNFHGHSRWKTRENMGRRLQGDCEVMRTIIKFNSLCIRGLSRHWRCLLVFLSCRKHKQLGTFLKLQNLRNLLHPESVCGWTREPSRRLQVKVTPDINQERTRLAVSYCA